MVDDWLLSRLDPERVRFPIGHPGLFRVELVDDIVYTLQLLLIFGSYQVALTLYVIIKVFIVVVADLAVAVVGLRLGYWHLLLVVVYTFCLRTLTDASELKLLLGDLLDLNKLLDTIDLLFESLAWVHSLGSVGDEVVDVVLVVVALRDHWWLVPQHLSSDLVKLVVNLLVMLAQIKQLLLFD